MPQNFSLTALEQRDEFIARHIGSPSDELDAMLDAIGAPNLDTLIDQTVPPAIRLPAPMPLADARPEAEALAVLKTIAGKNRVNKSLIGMGYNDTLAPKVIVRNVLENPGWYTAYTPYQAEIAQGRLEALLNYQQMVIDLTGLELANASLLDEATAAAEARPRPSSSRPTATRRPSRTSRHALASPASSSSSAPRMKPHSRKSSAPSSSTRTTRARSATFPVRSRPSSRATASSPSPPT